MGIQENIRFPDLEEPGERPGVYSIRLDKVPVQVKVLCITTESCLFRPFLVDPVKRASDKQSADIIHGYNANYRVVEVSGDPVHIP